MLMSGLVLYVLAALACALATTFPALLLGRFVHGLAAASVTVMRSVIRDLYSGRHMAKVMSLTFVVFLMVPIVAPSIGALILLIAPWRFIFAVFGAFAAAVAVWLMLRLPETLHPEYRLTLNRVQITKAVRLVLLNRASMFYTLALTVMFASIMAYVGEVSQIFADVFHRPTWMPGMFALCAVFMGIGAFTNSRIVERYGMRLISHAALLTFIAVTAVHTLVAYLGYESMWSFVAFQAVTMGCVSLALSNFGAMAMEPVGSVAGIAASLQGFISTFSGALVGGAIGRAFNGSTVPLAAGAVGCGLMALIFVLFAERGRLFTAHHADDGQTAGGKIEGAGVH
jgi:DHA1 family bicyclomycin/chloramphenicol resistance-like MFS transporter